MELQEKKYKRMVNIQYLDGSHRRSVFNGERRAISLKRIEHHESSPELHYYLLRHLLLLPALLSLQGSDG